MDVEEAVVPGRQRLGGARYGALAVREEGEWCGLVLSEEYSYGLHEKLPGVGVHPEAR